jgi:hypothetical protein
MAPLDGRSLFVDPENPENDLEIISIDRKLDRWGGVGFGATLAQTSCKKLRQCYSTSILTCDEPRESVLSASDKQWLHIDESQILNVLRHEMMFSCEAARTHQCA